MIVSDRVSNPAARSATERLGWDIWTMALEQFGDEPFKISELVPAVRTRFALSDSTAHQYIEATLKSLLDEGNGHAVRVNTIKWRVATG